MQGLTVLGYLLWQGPTERPQIQRDCGISHASLWNALELLVQEGEIETVGNGRPFKKAGIIKTYRATPYGFFGYMKDAEVMTWTDLFHGKARELFEGVVDLKLRESIIPILKKQPYLWPWLSNQISIFETVRAKELMDWIAKTFTAQGIYPEVWKVPSESEVWEDLKTLWIEVNYPTTFDKYEWVFGFEPHRLPLEERKILKPQLDRYLDVRLDLRKRLKEEWSRDLHNLANLSRAVDPILADLK